MSTPPTIADLLALPTDAQLEEDMTAVLRVPPTPFAVTSWFDTSIPKLLLTADRVALSKLVKVIPTIAAGGFLKTATGQWLTLFASSNYEYERGVAGFATRVIRIFDTGAGPQSFDTGSIVLQTSTGLVFRSLRNLDDSVPTLPATAAGAEPAYIDVRFSAESPGSAYNGAAGSWSLVTSIPGIAVALPPGAWGDHPSSGASPRDEVVVAGVDEESEDAVKAGASNKWSTLNAGHTDAGYVYDATHTPGVGARITRVKVRRHYPLPGMVTLIVAGPSAAGPDGADVVSPSDVALVQNYIDPPSHLGTAPCCVDVIVQSAKYKRIQISGTVYGLASEIEDGRVKGLSALDAWASKIRIGAPKVSREETIAKMLSGLSDDDLNDAALAAPLADIPLAIDEVPYFDTLGLSWSPV